MSYNDHNKTTIKAYEAGLDTYIAAEIHQTTGSVKEWLDFSLSLLPANAYVLELGSADGRDAQYMEDAGFKVDRTDVASSFVEFMKSKGKNARLLDALTDDFPVHADMIYANAVLLHFDDTQTKQVLHKVHKCLSPNGYFAFSVKIGEGESWSESKLGMPRFFNYWSAEKLKEVLRSSGFKIVYFELGNTGHDNGEWFHVTVRPLQK